ncbi:hypothetical protein [Natronobacterium gregoryi]|uniref:Uncharacterized protein n=2 Tax=Natronobacterium gregoryi TaxID=44930 RepID=L0AE10_NATGS|nr:hypothetical protein [Natronobacterium gregoryi]AFZ71654.1 hypothetical protein Natgr_0398 [Natronobacterium gregoryi SP2]ELY66273.1 hypothetical protein C490_13099 [Natronobacterium gregoryi SP2]PLK18745.1 hypothetical protein CYV19_17160 [Natronobacterium gregoryi SP2]SFJ65150.1 hypothetical protein SAMN05443661_1528 [Natronobacterium gregoryi]
MTSREDGTADEDSGAPTDFDRLEVVAERLATDDRFARVERQPEFAPDRVFCVYDDGFYPSSVDEVRLEIAWFENGDVSIHYHEDHEDGRFDHRWDRHPSDHNARDHVHPGPDAPTPGVDDSYPEDWRNVLAMGLGEIGERQRGFWTS